MTDVNEQIAATGDDGHSGSSFNNAPTNIILGNYSSIAYTAFFRFTGVAIPQGATINSAVLTLRAKTTLSGASIDLAIAASDVDDAPAPATKAELDGLARTSASVEWVPAAWTAGSSYESPDIASVIQEIVNRGGWASGNDLMILIDDDGSASGHYRTCYDYSGGAASAAILDVAYTEGGGEDTSQRWFAFF